VTYENFQRTLKIVNRYSLDVLTMFLSEQLSVIFLTNPKLNGGSTIAIVEAKATLVLAYKDTNCTASFGSDQV
jgi:hypothetical protein